MKKIVYYILGAAAMLAVASCAKNVDWDEVTPGDGQQGITLQFSNSTLTTKAAVPGINNENRVDRILFFVFPLNESGNVDDNTEYIFSGSYTGTETGWTHSAASGTDPEKWVYTKTMTTDELNALFPNGATKAKIFAIANYVGKYGSNNDMASPDTNFPEDKKTWKAIHELEVGATFFYDDKNPDFGLRWPHVMRLDEYTEGEGEDAVTKKDNLFFVMTCETDLELKKTEMSKAECKLARLASKVTATFDYENYREEKKDKDGDVSAVIMWVPQKDAGETRVFLSNAIERTTLGGPLTRSYVADSWSTATKPLGNGTRDIFEYAYNFMKDVPTVDGKKKAYFYTYPININEGDDNQPYLKLVLPWYGYKWVGEGDAPQAVTGDITTDSNWMFYKQKEVYYKIVLPRETIKDPNCIYEYNVKVNIIGSDKEVKIIGEQYVVKDWLSDNEISSNVAFGRYISLEIPKDEFDMFVDELNINFVSSGTVVAKVDTIYQWNYSATTPAKDIFIQDDNFISAHGKGYTEAQVRSWATIPNDASYLKINHAMDNRMLIDNEKNPAFDMAPYIYKVTLHLVDAGDDTSFDRTVTITQYPALYVTNKKSNGYAFVNSHSNISTSGNRICYDDNNEQLGNFYYYAGQLENPTGNNQNPNNYIITTSMLSDTNYILGDPRSAGSNLSGLNGLTNYRLTSGTGTENTIAPKLLVASSYGVISGGANGSDGYYIDKVAAEKRCAAYQENGYPAGRWRVPTAAEIIYMITLSNFGYIPSLFSFYADGNSGAAARLDSRGYWSANGKIIGTRSSNSDPFTPSLSTNQTYLNRKTAVRCVYDAWYWGEEQIDDNNKPTTTSPATTWRGYHDN